MVKIILILIKLIIGYFAFSGMLSLTALYLTNGLSTFLTFYATRNILKFKTWQFAVILIDLAIPIVGFITMGIFYFLTPLYFKIYDKHNKLLEDNDNGFDEQFSKYMQIQNARVQRVEMDSMQDKLLDSIQIQPYIDIFLGNNTDLKISACIKLSDFQNVQSVYLLKTALQDKEYEVRYMANNALENIEKKLIDKIDLLTDNIEKFPNLITYYKERAYTYLTIFNLNILDKYIGKMFLKRALDDLRHVVKYEPDNFHTYLNIAQVYTYLNMNEELILLVDKALKLDITEEHKSKLRYYRCEANFNKRNIGAVIKDSMNIDISYLDFDKVKESVNYWKEMSHE